MHYIWTGTEHAVCFIDDVLKAPVDTLGAAIRHDARLAPAGANVDFVQVGGAATGQLHMRTFEKGVEAETLACGTGATAAAIVARLLGHTASNTVAVTMPGGTLHIGFDLDDSTITNLYMEGPAEAIYRGTIEM